MTASAFEPSAHKEPLATLAQKRESAWICAGGGREPGPVFDHDAIFRPYFDQVWDLAEAMIPAPMSEDQMFAKWAITDRIAPYLAKHASSLEKMSISWANEETDIRDHFENQTIDRAKALRASSTPEQFLAAIAELTAALEDRQELESR